MITAVCLEAQAAFELNGNNRQTFLEDAIAIFTANMEKMNLQALKVRQQENLQLRWAANLASLIIGKKWYIPELIAET